MYQASSRERHVCLLTRPLNQSMSLQSTEEAYGSPQTALSLKDFELMTSAGRSTFPTLQLPFATFRSIFSTLRSPFSTLRQTLSTHHWGILVTHDDDVLQGAVFDIYREGKFSHPSKKLGTTLLESSSGTPRWILQYTLTRTVCDNDEIEEHGESDFLCRHGTQAYTT
jgi:hypothetical protein